MDVAIRGDRASCLTLQLGANAWLFAVARGFGTIDGMAREYAWRLSYRQGGAPALPAYDDYIAAGRDQ